MVTIIEKKLTQAGYSMFGDDESIEKLILDILMTKNIRLEVRKEYKKKCTTAHSVDHDKPEVIKRNIDNGTIPKVPE